MTIPPSLLGLPRNEQKAAARAALWRVGDLSWALHDDQLASREKVEAAYANGVRRAVFMCGRRWGKTRLFVADALEFGMKNPGARMPYGALTWESAANFVIPEVKALIPWCPADIRPAIVDGNIRFHNGSSIVLAGCEDELKADRLRGPSAHKAYLDEAGFIPVLNYVVKSVISQQLLTTDGMLWMASSPPETPAHPFAAEYLPTAAARDALVRRKTADAPHIKSDALANLIRELGGPDAIETRREIFCEILTDETKAVIPEWSAHRAIVAPEHAENWPEAEHRHWYVAADLGFKDLTVILLAWWDFANNRLVVEDERVLVAPNSPKVQAATKDMETQHGAKDVVSRVADASHFTISDLRNLEDSSVEEAARWRPAQKDDREAAINALRVMVSRHELLIHPRCKTTRAHCEFAVWNQNRTMFERSDDEGLSHFDGLASLIYLARSVRKTRNPVPPAPTPTYTAGVHIPQHLSQPKPKRIPRKLKRI